MKNFTVIIFLTFILFFAGCQKSQKAPSKKKAPKKLSGQAFYSNLKLTAKVNGASYKPRENINVDVVLSNTGRKDIKFSFASAQRFDLVAKNKQGEEVYRWSRGKLFAQALVSVTLKPNRKIKQQYNFNLNKKGNYQITAETVKIYFEQGTAKILITSPIKISAE